MVDLNDPLLGEREENEQRKALTISESVVGREIERIERGRAQERQGARTDLQPSGNFPGRDTRDKVGPLSACREAKKVVEATEGRGRDRRRQDPASLRAHRPTTTRAARLTGGPASALGRRSDVGEEQALGVKQRR